MEKKTIRQTGLEVIRRLENQEELQTFSEFQQKLRYFKKRFEDEEFRIAVVGEFSSGKSTFINALIGQDVLQHAKKETTATITRLVNVSPQDTRCGKGNVKLHSGEIVTLNDFTSLKEYTTTASDKLDVAAEVEQAELFVPLLKTVGIGCRYTGPEWYRGWTSGTDNGTGPAGTCLYLSHFSPRNF